MSNRKPNRYAASPAAAVDRRTRENLPPPPVSPVGVVIDDVLADFWTDALADAQKALIDDVPTDGPRKAKR